VNDKRIVVTTGIHTINIVIIAAGDKTKYGNPSSNKVCLVSIQLLNLVPLIVSFSTVLASLKHIYIKKIPINTKNIASIPSIMKMIDLSSLPPSAAKVIRPAIPSPL